MSSKTDDQMLGLQRAHGAHRRFFGIEVVRQLHTVRLPWLHQWWTWTSYAASRAAVYSMLCWHWWRMFQQQMMYGRRLDIASEADPP